ncbi:unnamed protein product [Camellia sinensis]
MIRFREAGLLIIVVDLYEQDGRNLRRFVVAATAAAEMRAEKGGFEIGGGGSSTSISIVKKGEGGLDGQSSHVGGSELVLKPRRWEDEVNLIGFKLVFCIQGLDIVVVVQAI